MTLAEENELRALKVHKAAWEKSIAERERVVADERRALAGINARIEALTPKPEPAPAPAAEPPKPAKKK